MTNVLYQSARLSLHFIFTELNLSKASYCEENNLYSIIQFVLWLATKVEKKDRNSNTVKNEQRVVWPCSIWSLSVSYFELLKEENRLLGRKKKATRIKYFCSERTNLCVCDRQTFQSWDTGLGGEKMKRQTRCGTGNKSFIIAQISD